MNNITPLANEDFPSLYQSSDTASINAQSTFMKLLKSDLILLVLGSLICTITFNNSEIQTWMNIIAAAFLLCAFIISLALKFSRYEHTWYGARAIAESVKTLSWRYMMGSEPFNLALSSKEVDRLFTHRLSNLLTEKKHLAYDFKENLSDQISEKMRSLRAETTLARKEYYLSQRVKEQRDWYNTKSTFNKSQEKRYFSWALGMQFISFLLALYQIKNPHAMNLVAVFSTATTSILSWMQTRKFQELAQVYSLTAQELGLVEANATSITNDHELSEFISDAENAISREHTMWIARRSH